MMNYIEDDTTTITLLNNIIVEDNINLGIIDRIENQRKRLTDIIKNARFYDRIDLNIIKKAYDAAKNSVELFLRGKLVQSINEIQNCFFASNRQIYLRTKEWSNKGELNAFRIRPNDSYTLYSTEEMFHIPFDKRYLVGNQRFSYSGFPCLYIGRSIYVCWEEMNRPDIDKFNVIALKNTLLINYLDLTLPQFSESDIDNIEEKIYKSILSWLCSMIVKNKDVPFIEEYIIPQNIMAVILSYDNRGENQVTDLLTIQGIAYTSTLYSRKEALFRDIKLMTNYAIPILNKELKEEGLCKYLCDQFELTAPTSIITERIKKDRSISDRSIDGESTYSKTEFGLLENTVQKRDYKKITYK